MKYSFFLLPMICLFGCSKQSESDTQQISVSASTKNENSNPENIIDEKKKYAPKICYIVGDPNSLGTICEDPGTQCKAYECTATSARSNSSVLSESEIEFYSSIDVQLLLKKDLISPKDTSLFKSLSKQVLNKRNKLLQE